MSVSSPVYVDSHCHLDRLDLSPYDGDLAAALVAARERGVGDMLCVGIDMANAEAVMAIAREHEGVYASVGLHPMDIGEQQADFSQLEAWARQPEVVAIGETGLDYYYSDEHAQRQQDSFRQHLQLSSRLQKPVIVHTRDAREDTLHIIREHGDTSVGGVLHCFTESLEMAQQALELNYFISFSGIITFKNAAELREVVAAIPLERMLIETDSPYLAPVPFRGKKNEPRYVPEVAACIAEIKSLPVERVAQQTRENFESLFRLNT